MTTTILELASEHIAQLTRDLAACKAENGRLFKRNALLADAAQYALARVRAAAHTDKPALFGVVNRLEKALNNEPL